MAKATGKSVAYREAELTEIKKNSRKFSKENIQCRFIKAVSFKQVLGFAIALVLGSFIVYNNMVLTQLTDEAEKKTQQLEALKSEYTYLEAKEENAYSLSDIEEYAQKNLNMIKMDSSQVEYIELSNPDQIEVSDSAQGISSTVSLIAKGFHAIWNSFK